VLEVLGRTEPSSEVFWSEHSLQLAGWKDMLGMLFIQRKR